MADPRVTAAMCAYGRTLAEPRLSPGGELVAFLANVGGRGQLVLVDARGGPEVVVTSDGPQVITRFPSDELFVANPY